MRPRKKAHATGAQPHQPHIGYREHRGAPTGNEDQQQPGQAADHSIHINQIETIQETSHEDPVHSIIYKLIV